MKKRFLILGVTLCLVPLVFAGCGKEEIERLKAENVKVKEANVKLQRDLETALGGNAEMQAKLDKIREIVCPPAPEPQPQVYDPAAVEKEIFTKEAVEFFEKVKPSPKEAEKSVETAPKPAGEAAPSKQPEIPPQAELSAPPTEEKQPIEKPKE